MLKTINALNRKSDPNMKVTVRIPYRNEYAEYDMYIWGELLGTHIGQYEDIFTDEGKWWRVTIWGGD